MNLLDDIFLVGPLSMLGPSNQVYYSPYAHTHKHTLTVSLAKVPNIIKMICVFTIQKMITKIPRKRM